MDDHFDIARVFEIGKFDITRLTCTSKGFNKDGIHSQDRPADKNVYQ